MASSEPGLDDTETAFRHESTLGLLKRFLTFAGMSSPGLNGLVQKLVVRNLGNPLGRFFVRWSFDLFLAGEDLRGCRKTLDHLAKYRAQGILDFMAEGEDNEAGRERTAREIARTLEFCGRGGVRFAACKPSGLMDVEVLRKVAAGTPLSPDEETRHRAGFDRLSRLADLAAERGVRLFVDAEWIFMQGEVDRMVVELMARHNRTRPVVYHTLQMYRRDRLDYLEEILARSRREGWWFGLKLVRGAYLDFERANNDPDPIHASIEDTHRAYDRAVDRCLDELEHVAVVVATHNRASIQHTLDELDRRGLARDDERVEVSQLLGMSDALTFNAARMGVRSHKYLPYGPLDEAVPYLIRRAQENTAITKDSARELGSVSRELVRRFRTRLGA